MAAEWSSGAPVRTSKVACDRVASPLGSNSNPGTVTKPYATVERLANSLRSGQTGCLRAGVYQRDVKVTRGGAAGAPTTITSFPSERATVAGRLHMADEANNVVVEQLDLDGRNRAGLPSPTINGDNVVFRDNDVTNHHTAICFLLGSAEWGRARGTVIEHNRIHNCGEMPPTNHHHGIYVELSDDARITGNWIYDNADRGVQLFPDAQGTYVAGNVIDGNGQGVVFSRDSANNVVEHNVLSNPLIRYNIESYELTGGGNIARRNCLWSTRHWGNAGIQLDVEVPMVENLVTEPGYVNRDGKDFRLLPASPCINFSPTVLGPGPSVVKARQKGGRPVRLRASASVLWPGRRLVLRARTLSNIEPAGTSSRPVLKLRHRGRWHRVQVMRRRGAGYVAGVRLEKLGRRAVRR
ncbi:MAG: right-handed parallel beta-helix repeat-containing protein, partial [Solirubrobacterales bacterium]